MKGKRSRQAKFVSAMALYYKGKPVAIAKGEVRGTLTAQERGTNGFGYDPIFVPAGFSKTFAELTPKTKNRISHRAKALKAIRKSILNFYINSSP